MALVTAQGDAYSYHFDATGNTIALTDQSGNIVSTYAYQPYGEMTQGQTQTITQPFTYVGRYGVMAEGSGYYYMRARYYDSGAGRFLSEDPLGFGGGDVNLYAYVAGNPVGWIDPLGLSAKAPHAIEEQWDVYFPLAGVSKVIRSAISAYKIWTTISDDISASTPIGRSGDEIHVPRGTNPSSTINGREYSGHALDRMQGRGITPSVIDDAINTGAQFAGRDGATMYTNNQVRVIVNQNGKVITVYPQ